MKNRWWGLLLLAHSGKHCTALVTKRVSSASSEESASRQPPLMQDTGALEHPEYQAAIEQEEQMRQEEHEQATERMNKIDRKRSKWMKRQEKDGWAPRLGAGLPMWESDADYFVYPRDYHYDQMGDYYKQGSRTFTRAETDEGKKEQPSYEMGWMPPQPEVVEPQTECAEQCHENEYCWEGECTWRPWQYAGAVRKSCYADPYQPGLSRSDKNFCRDEHAVQSEEDCTAMAWYCHWTFDAPDWYRGLLNEKDSERAKKWKEEQDAINAIANSGKAFDKAARHVQPGNTIYKSLLPPPPERTLSSQPYLAKDRFVWR